jgi:hypothetical protein
MGCDGPDRVFCGLCADWAGTDAISLHGSRRTATVSRTAPGDQPHPTPGPRTQDPRPGPPTQSPRTRGHPRADGLMALPRRWRSRSPSCRPWLGFSVQECSFPGDEQDPRQVPSSQVRGTPRLFDQVSDTHTRESARLAPKGALGKNLTRQGDDAYHPHPGSGWTPSGGQCRGCVLTLPT